MLFLVLRHVECDQRVFVAEQELGQRLGQLSLANAGWAQEDERAAWALGVLETSTGAADCLADSLDAVFLANDPLMQFIFHPQQFCGLLFRELVDRNTSPDRQHVGDSFLIDLVEQVDTLGFNLGLKLLFVSQQFFFAIPK